MYLFHLHLFLCVDLSSLGIEEQVAYAFGILCSSRFRPQISIAIFLHVTRVPDKNLDAGQRRQGGNIL